jgi:hypothetical protein
MQNPIGSNITHAPPPGSFQARYRAAPPSQCREVPSSTELEETSCRIIVFCRGDISLTVISSLIVFRWRRQVRRRPGGVLPLPPRLWARMVFSPPYRSDTGFLAPRRLLLVGYLFRTPLPMTGSFGMMAKVGMFRTTGLLGQVRIYSCI